MPSPSTQTLPNIYSLHSALSPTQTEVQLLIAALMAIAGVLLIELKLLRALHHMFLRIIGAPLLAPRNIETVA